jgi:hypothetical protein
MILFFFGLSRIVLGIFEKDFVDWWRAGQIVVGVLIVLLALAAFTSTLVATALLLIFLSVALMTIGVIRIAGAVTGYP